MIFPGLDLSGFRYTIDVKWWFCELGALLLPVPKGLNEALDDERIISRLDT